MILIIKEHKHQDLGPGVMFPMSSPALLATPFTNTFNILGLNTFLLTCSEHIIFHPRV